jgi:hypothetical protein
MVDCSELIQASGGSGAIVLHWQRAALSTARFLLKQSWHPGVLDPMTRKYLFWGLTLLLAVALIFLILRSDRIKERPAGKPVEVSQESKPTATRVLKPQDVIILQSSIQLEKESNGKKQSQAARHTIEIRNDGNVSYSSIQLSLVYLGFGGKTMTIKSYNITDTLAPGSTLKLTDIKITGLPVSTANCKIAVSYADIK